MRAGVISARRACFDRQAIETCPQDAVIARVVEQEGIVAVRCRDLGVADVEPVVDERLDDLARARRREAPVGREADELEAAARPREGRRQVAAVRPRRIEVVEGAGDEQVGVGVEVLAELVALVAQVGLDLELDPLPSPMSATSFTTLMP